MQGRLDVLVIDEPEADLLAVDDLVVVILPEQGHHRLPGEELREDLAVPLLVLRAVGAAHLPGQAELADEDALRGQAGLGDELGVHVVQGGADLVGGEELAVVRGVGDEIDVRLGEHRVHQAPAAVLQRVADAVHLGVGIDPALRVRHFGAGVFDGLLADVEPLDHRRDELRRGVLLHVLVRKEIPIAFPMAEEERLARGVVAREQVLGEEIDGVVFAALELGREALRPLVGRTVPQDVMGERQGDVGRQLLAGDGVDLEDARAHRADALRRLEHRFVLRELIRGSERLRADDLRERIGHRRHRGQRGHLEGLIAAVLLLRQQGEREQQKGSQ